MAQSRWSKHRYPLQAVMEDAPTPSAADGKLDVHQPEAMRDNHALFSPSQLTVDDYSDDQSSTAGLMSRSLTRTGDEDNASSTTLHSRNDLDPSRLHERSWSGGTFHMLSTTNGTAVMRPPSLSTDGSDNAMDQSRPGSINTLGDKTLRRTSRHRRIESPIPLSLDQESSGNSTLPDWSQQRYPHEPSERDLTSSVQTSPQKELPSSASKETSRSHGPIDTSSTDQSTKYQSWSAHHAPVSDPAIAPRGSSTTQKLDPPSHEITETPRSNKTWRRSAYPLQMATGNTNIRSPPTPPPSPPQANSSNQGGQPHLFESGPDGAVQSPQRAASPNLTESDEPDRPLRSSIPPTVKEQPNVTRIALKRQIYPLQSPASTLDLRSEPLGSLPNDHDSKEKFSNISEPKVTHQTPPTMPGLSNSSLSKASIRRQVYPLQSPASIPNLQQPVVPRDLEGVPEKGKSCSPVDSSDEISQSHQQQQTKPRAARRQGYPLQTPISNHELTYTSLLISTTETAKEHEQAVEQSVSHTEIDENDRTRTTATPFRRHAYPLQAPAEKGNDHEAYPTPSPEVTKAEGESYFDSKHGMYEEPESMGNPRSPRSPTSPRSPLRRRQTYPMQFIEDDFIEPPSPEASNNEEGDDDYYPPDVDRTKKILLPRHIPAIKNPEKASAKGRTIVVCLDGTGDKFDNDNSNIVHIVSALKKDDPHQVTYYQAGIGTYSANGLSKGFAAASDMAVGSGLGLHVRDAYHFLMHVYKENDRICIFGFSRGAYTARCLAGMIHKVGLLPPRNDQQIVFAYEFYKDNTREGWQQSEDFKKAFCIDVNVHFLGCFDSVASVGFIPRQLPLSTTPTNKPKYFRHAMALDERRAKFKICRHQTQNWDDIKPAHATKSDDQLYREKHHPNLTNEEYDRLAGPDRPFETDVLEVWFAGAHADVGGGAVLNTERHKLAQIPLRWMIRQAFECNTGILFKSRILAEFGLDVHTLWPKYSRLKAPSQGPAPSFLERFKTDLPPRLKRKSKLIPTNEHQNGEQLYHLKSPWDDEWTPEQVEDFYDAMMPINDQLIQAPTWWILEAIPVEYKVPIEPGKAITRTGPNCGQYRGVEDVEPNLHWTVRRRMEQMGYKIHARTAKHTKWRIVV